MRKEIREAKLICVICKPRIKNPLRCCGCERLACEHLLSSYLCRRCRTDGTGQTPETHARCRAEHERRAQITRQLGRTNG